MFLKAFLKPRFFCCTIITAWVVLLCSANRLLAQEMLGIANSNFAGNMGIEMNPASIATMPYRFEINILSGDIFLENDYIYFPANKIPTGNFARLTPLAHEDYSDHYNKPPKNAYVNLLFKGPSAVWRKEKYAYGIHFSLRSQASVNKLPFHLAKFIWEGSDYVPQQKISYTSTPTQSAGLLCGEIGFTIAKSIRKKNADITTGGLTLNGLLGMSGMYINSKVLDYEFVDQSLLVVKDIDINYGHALPDDGTKNYLHPRGYGASVNLGVQHLFNYIGQAYKPGMGGTRLKKYIAKVGVSLLDVGFISFSENAHTFDLKNASTIWPGFDTTKITGINNADSLYSVKFYNDQFASQAHNGFAIFTPMALSVQGDLCITPMFYFNVTAVQNIQLLNPGVKRASQVSLTPRYETRRLEVSLPLSLYEYNFFRAGLAVRYKWFVLGTDNLGWWPGLYEMNGFDFYFGFKYTSDIYDNGRFKRGKGGHCPAYK